MSDVNEQDFDDRIRRLFATAGSAVPDTSNAQLPLPRVKPQRGRWLAAAATLVLVVAAVAVLAMRSPARQEPVSVTDPPPPSSALAPTTVALSTTDASSTTTTSEATTTTSLVPALTLRGNGIGAWEFGSVPDPIIVALSEAFGQPTDDETLAFEPTERPGEYVNEGSVFAHPFGRIACWTGALCVHFGGDTADELLFVGWYYDDDGSTLPRALSSAEGIAPGSRQSDHLDAIEITGGMCYSSNTGVTPDGVQLDLLSYGDPYFTYDTTGQFILGDPAPEDVVITAMHAGDQLSQFDADC